LLPVKAQPATASRSGKRVELSAMLKGILTPEQFRRVQLMGKANLTDA
jgi:hypothetical protein